MTWEGGNHVHELEEDSEPLDLGFLALHWLGLLWLELDTDDSPDVRDPDEEGSECDKACLALPVLRGWGHELDDEVEQTDVVDVDGIHSD